MDLDLRKLRYFVAVASQLHFGRAAGDLHIAQPVLSRQIRALEHDLGASLFTRDSHGVTLTEAGKQLLADAGPPLASAHAARRRVAAAPRRGQRPAAGGRLGVVGPRAGRAVRAAPPGLPLDVAPPGRASRPAVVAARL